MRCVILYNYAVFILSHCRPMVITNQTLQKLNYSKNMKKQNGLAYIHIIGVQPIIWYLQG